MIRWGKNVANKRLPSEAPVTLSEIPSKFLAGNGRWEQEFPYLQQSPLVNPNGIIWGKPSNRVM